MTTEIPQCDMIIMFVQSDKYNPKLLFFLNTQCEPGFISTAFFDQIYQEWQ